ncbi:MAG: sulfotransferase [Planctomycetes bacterium]|nr:sulfotransferase [Planctomycetota bacterium]
MSKTAILVASRNRKDLVDAFGDWAARNVKTPHDLYVVECGSAPAQWSARSTLAYDDPDFLGKCFGHNLALRQAMTEAAARGGYDDYWVVMNDLVFAEGVDPLARLHDAFDREPRLALVSPTEVGGHYPGAEAQAGGGVRPITTCDYLGFLIRAAAVREVGFLNPAFRYCWGAIHELSFQLHRRGWWLGYSDDVSYRHLGGSTYGAKDTQTISRAEYQRRARRFAYPYFQKLYGADWERRFFAAARPFGATIDTYAAHRAYWATAFSAAELAELDAQASVVADESLASGGSLATATRRSATLPIGWRSNPCALTSQHDALLGRVQARSLLGASAKASAAPIAAPVEPLVAAATPAALPAGPRARMAACFTRADLKPVAPGWRVGPPDFVGLGCGKSGGSWWYELLQRHPQVVPNRLDAKELHYFCHHDFRGPDDAAKQLYREAFARPDGKVCGEWSGNFLNHPLALGYLLDTAPDAKFVAILRNPVDRAVSNWNQFLHGRKQLLGLEGERERLLEDYSLFPEALWSCRIADALHQLFARVPRSQVLVLQYEALKAAPLPAWQRTCEFLGIDPRCTPRDFEQPVNRKPYLVPKPDAAARARLADYFADDVAATAALLPELDLALWRDFAPTAPTAPTAPRRSTRADVERLFAAGKPRRLLLGCGKRPDPQAINVDVDPAASADLLLDAADLAALPDGSIEEIKSFHLFEHFTREQARRALREWRRVLAPNGTVAIECPNLAVCARELGRHFDPHGEDLALTGLFGPPERADDPAQRHNWGWTPETLAKELLAAGFREPTLHPIEQTWRAAARFGRDMQVRARK